MSLFVWLWAAKKLTLSLATLPFLYYLRDLCGAHHTHTVLSCTVLVYEDSPLQSCCWNLPVWGYVERTEWSDTSFPDFNIFQSPLEFSWHQCIYLRLSTLCSTVPFKHKVVPKYLKSGTVRGWHHLEKLSRDSERTTLVMHFTISKTHSHLYSWTWVLDVLPYLLLLFTLSALCDRALDLKATCPLLVSLFKNCLTSALKYTQRYLTIVLVNLLN